MIRFLTHILDIKNLLGMQRVVPPTPPTPIVNPSIILRDYNAPYSCTFIPTFADGELIVQYLSGGELTEERYNTSYSGQTISVIPDDGIVKIKVDSAYSLSSFECGSDITALKVRDRVENVLIPQSVTTLDFDELEDNILSIVPTETQFNVNVFMAVARTTAERDASIDVITNNVRPGTGCYLFIDNTDAYATDVINAATARGWYVS